MEAWVAFTATALAFGAILALFVPRRQLLLLAVAAVAGIVAPVLFEWRASQGVVQVIYLISALCVVSAILSYLWPWKAWQWGLMPFLADALWQVMGFTPLFIGVDSGRSHTFSHSIPPCLWQSCRLSPPN